MSEELQNINEIMDRLRPTTLATLSAIVPNLVSPGIDAGEFLALNSLSGAAFDAGIRNYGDDFIPMCFDAVAKAQN